MTLTLDSLNVDTIQDSAAPATAWNTAHLVFEVASQPYACPISRIHRLMRAADAKLLPPKEGAPAWETSRLMLDNSGEAIPVVSLRDLWSLPLLAGPQSERQAFLVAPLEGELTALLVDACLCVLPSLPLETASFPVPAPLKSRRSQSLDTAVPWKHSLLITLRLDELLPHESRNTT